MTTLCFYYILCAVALPFLNRADELARLRGALDQKETSLVVVFGRRRLGKSRLVLEALGDRPAIYYVGDDRDAALQREDLARQAEALIPDLSRVRYPDWAALLDRILSEAAPGTVLALDELPTLVRSSPELPSLLQKLVDRPPGPCHLVVAGSSQRMMQGLTLDASAPLFGRAREILEIRPMTLPWMARALGVSSAADAVSHYAVWGGVPRYWELARDYPDLASAMTGLVLDPLGPLHREPERLLLDDISDVARTSSILALVGRGVRRVSEMGRRLGLPATSLSRPLARLVDLGYLIREVPFGRSVRDTKRSFYRIADPLTRFWYRFVEPNRSRLAGGQVEAVARQVMASLPEYEGQAFEAIVRDALPRVEVRARRFHPGQRWWGRAADGEQMELDVVAESVEDSGVVLVGEVKRSATAREARSLLAALAEKAGRCPALEGRTVLPSVWVLRARGRLPPGVIPASRLLEP